MKNLTVVLFVTGMQPLAFSSNCELSDVSRSSSVEDLNRVQNLGTLFWYTVAGYMKDQAFQNIVTVRNASDDSTSSEEDLCQESVDIVAEIGSSVSAQLEKIVGSRIKGNQDIDAVKELIIKLKRLYSLLDTKQKNEENNKLIPSFMKIAYIQQEHLQKIEDSELISPLLDIPFYSVCSGLFSLNNLQENWQMFWQEKMKAEQNYLINSKEDVWWLDKLRKTLQIRIGQAVEESQDSEIKRVLSDIEDGFMSWRRRNNEI